MDIKEGEIAIGGNIEVISVELQLFQDVINKQKKETAKLSFNLKISCEIEGAEIEPIYTQRLFELSKGDFDKLVNKGIVSEK